MSFTQLFGIVFAVCMVGVVLLASGSLVGNRYADSQKVRLKALRHRYSGAAIIIVCPFIWLGIVINANQDFLYRGVYGWMIWWHDIMALPVLFIIVLGLRLRIRWREIRSMPPDGLTERCDDD